MADRTVTIFVSSPGDLPDERAVLDEVVRRLAYDPFITRHASLQLVSWDNPAGPVPLPASEHAQAAVDSMLPRPSRCDIVVGIFWTRLGTPLPQRVFAGADGSGYPSGTAWEIDDALAAAGRPDAPDVLLYRKTAPASVPLGSPDWQRRAEQFAALEEYLTALTGRLGERGPGQIARFDTLERFRSLVDAHLRRLIARRLRLGHGDHTRSTGPARRYRGRSPYPGLVSFTPADADVFFGRDAEVDALVDLARQAPLVAVVGPSGSGKSSVIGAGLIPRLAAFGTGPGGWRTPTYDAAAGTWRGGRLTPAGGTGGPLRSLALALDPTGGPEPSGGLATWCRRAAARVRDRGERLLVYVDQFEEAFSATDPTTSREFVDTIVALADEDLATIVLSLRADFLGTALQHEGLARRMRGATLPVGPPGLAALSRMITEPARIAGLTFEPDLPQQVLVDVRREPGALPLLAFALSELHRCRDGDLLTHAAYAELGGVAGAVGRLAERCVDRLPPHVRVELPRTFRRLVGLDEAGGPIRRKVPIAALHRDPRLRSLVDALVAARLLVVGSESGDEPWVELAHEALFRGWPRLAEWIDAAHADLRTVSRARRAAAEWAAADRDPLLLWSQERMDQVFRAAARLDDHFSAEENEFLEPEAERLLAELSDPATGHLRRREVAARLDVVGDRRPGVGVLADGLPDIVWRALPGDGGSPMWMARYPVTRSQITAYRSTTVSSDTPLQDGTEMVSSSAPAAVSWYEATDFCNWVTWAVRRGTQLVPEARTDYVVRLPTESEWMRAAGAARYPWGDRFDESRANTASSRLGEPIAVGMYPRGDSAAGISDLAGNVWEWCADSVSAESGHHMIRTMKGGSTFEDPERCVVTGYRRMRGGVVRVDRGFRVCYGPAPRTGGGG